MHSDPRPSGFLRLRRALAAAEGEYEAGSRPTVATLLEPLGADSAALAGVLIALPFLSPVSMGPITAPASIAIALLGWKILRPSRRGSLPARILATQIPRRVHIASAAMLAGCHRLVERFSRPRAPHLVTGRRGRMICGIGMIIGAVLLAVPIPLLPLTNTVPSIAIVCFGLGWVEQDGMVTMLGVGALVLAATIFTALGAAVALLGGEVVGALLRFGPG